MTFSWDIKRCLWQQNSCISGIELHGNLLKLSRYRMSERKCFRLTGTERMDEMRRCLSMSCTPYWCLGQNNHSWLKLRRPVSCKSISLMFIAAEVSIEDPSLVLGSLTLSWPQTRCHFPTTSVSWTVRLFTRCSLTPGRQPVPEEVRCYGCSVTSWMFLLVCVGA